MSELPEETLGRAIGEAINEQLIPLRRRVSQLEADNLELRSLVKLMKESGLNYRDVYQENTAYEPGDAVISGGQFWRAHAITKDKPPSPAWRLICKKGRDGRDGKDAA